MAAKKKTTPQQLTQPSKLLVDPEAQSPFGSLDVSGEQVAAVTEGEPARLSVFSRTTGALLEARDLLSSGTPRLLPGAQAVAFARRGATKVSGDYSGFALEPRVPRPGISSYSVDDFPGVISIVGAPNGAHLALSGFVPIKLAHYVWLCDAEGNRLTRIPSFEVGPVEPFFERLVRESAAPCIPMGGIALHDDALAVAVNGKVQVFAVPSLELRWEAPLRGATPLAFSPRGDLLVKTSVGRLVAFDAQGTQRWEARFGRNSMAPAAAWSADGRVVLVTGVNTLLDGATGNQLAYVRTSSFAVALSADGRQAMTAPREAKGTIEVWDLPEA
jgi:PQQ-like domain